MDIRGIDDNDWVSFNHLDDAGNWRAERVPAAAIPDLQVAYAGVDVWVGVNPVPAVGRGRGGNADITRLAALVCELDFDKLAGAAAGHVITDLAGIVGWPSLLVFSGHGFHAYWPVDRDAAGELSGPSAAVLAARFGLLVAVVARSRGGAVDTVSDLARVLRCVGTTNRKRAPAVRVRGYEIGRGRPVFPDQVSEILDEFGIAEVTADEATREIVSPPSTWAYRPERITAPCKYVTTVAGGWHTDPVRGGRHNWLLDQAVRLHEFHRRGCLGSREQYEDLRAQLRTAFFRRLAGAGGTTPRAELPPNEFELVLAWSIRRTATKTDRQVVDDSGQLHAHDKRAIEAAELDALTKGAVPQ